jgi:hypothetical protein
MSEETQDHNDGTWSGLKKTIIGTATTLIAGGGTWLGVAIFGGGSDDKEETKTEQVSPVQPSINLNIDNSSQNNSSNNGGGTTTIIKETQVVPAQQPTAPVKKSETEDSPW